jgi:L-fuconolactonase
MWGSDWPVVTLAASYDDWLMTSDALLGGLTPAEREAIFGGNAARFYELDA